ncbi:hypothetical protein F5X71_02550 [Nocardia brasiliensis]|uniref:Uncharacterized protein n=1 Tax=Nocardia brasiliensis TaxID=37326 RepID=A0A6G9XKA6_NOCBR|nr:hypothetical protein [Nocardia brasiliensis]QIS01338.1 hypothetical protein F5X71_02550 [Nocardia brasiliensis]
MPYREWFGGNGFARRIHRFARRVERAISPATSSADAAAPTGRVPRQFAARARGELNGVLRQRVSARRRLRLSESHHPCLRERRAAIERRRRAIAVATELYRRCGGLTARIPVAAVLGGPAARNFPESARLRHFCGNFWNAF